jgi:hypothetical protein
MHATLIIKNEIPLHQKFIIIFTKFSMLCNVCISETFFKTFETRRTVPAQILHILKVCIMTISLCPTSKDLKAVVFSHWFVCYIGEQNKYKMGTSFIGQVRVKLRK